jgi:hypothetical protein
MADWGPYQSCCYTAALNRDSGFCTECGRPLFRCAAFDRCRGLINPLGHCPVCVQPRLMLEKEAVLEARVGEVLSIPFLLSNGSPAGRPLRLLNLLKDEPDAFNESVPLNWEKLDAGQERTFSVLTSPLAHSGIHRLRLTLILASCAAGFEEHYAFSGEIALQVEGGGPTQVVQNFDLSHSDFGTAGMVVANPSVRPSGNGQVRRLRDRVEVPLEGAERYELEQGYRGYAASATRIARNTVLRFKGFLPADHPPRGPLVTPLPLLRCGRNSRRYHPQRNTRPNDLCLRVYDPASGELDVAASRAISRHVGDFLIQNNRLYLRAQGDNRLLHNSEPLHAGELRLVKDADVLTLPPGHPRAFSLSIRFTAVSGVVEHLDFERSPRMGP